MKTTLLTLLTALLVIPTAQAMPLEMPLQGVLRDNAGAPVAADTFEMTFAIYETAEADEALWTETREVTVAGGQFRLNLGTDTPLGPSLFAASGALWLGVTVESEPELPRRPMGTTPYAFQAASASGLACSGCVEPEALSPASLQVVREEALVAVAEAGYAVDAAGLPLDGEAAGVEATDVQSAIGELKTLLDEATDGGGGITGDVNEGAGQVVAYELARDVQGGESLKQYVHLVNPATPKVIAYIYGELDANAAEPFIDPSPTFIEDPVQTSTLNFDTHSHGGGYSPYYKEFWYPQWSGCTVYRHDLQGGQFSSFNVPRCDLMQLWGDPDGSFYVAHWGNGDRIARYAGLGGASEVWGYDLGSTAGGVCANHEYVYAMRNSGNNVWKFDKVTGEVLEQFSLPNIPNGLHGGLTCVGNRLYYGRSNPVRVYDLDTHQQIDTFDVGETVSNLSFDGKTMWISNNDSSLRGYQLVEDTIYQYSRAPRNVQIHVDGVDVTAALGNPNAKDATNYDVATGTWGATGKDAWSTGQLDLTNVTDWTLGEHTVEIKETGGLGGEIKGYVYVIYPFTESTPPVNDGCDSPVSLEVTEGPVVVSGTTEDTMGKILATDTQNGGEGCTLEGGPDAIYRIDLTERSLINAAITSPFPASLYVRSGDCESGDVVYCGGDTITTNPLEPGTYYLVIDGDTPGAKGDYALAASLTPAVLPSSDTCETALELIFSGQGVATHTGSTLYALDQYQGWCDPSGGGADVVYTFEAGTGQTVQIDLSGAEFDPIIHLYRGEETNCGDAEAVSWCVTGSSYQLQGQQGGTYYLIIDGTADKQWGAYDLTVSLQ